MVWTGVAEERERVHNRESMAMGTERSKPLHNFTLPCLRWGSQKYLRCKKVESTVGGGGGGGDSAVDRRSSGSRFVDDSPTSGYRREADYERRRFARDSERRSVKVSKSKIDGEDGIEAVREKLMFDLKTAADRMKDAILRADDDDDHEDVSVVAPAPAPAEDARPWNLRTRRAACKAPVVDGGGKGLRVEERKPNYSPGRSGDGGSKSGATEKERPKFSVALSKREIEEDYMAMLGERPPRRPKKRSRNVQKQLDSLFPGLWLTEVSEDMYKVPELPETGKR